MISDAIERKYRRARHLFYLYPHVGPVALSTTQSEPRIGHLTTKISNLRITIFFTQVAKTFVFFHQTFH